MSLEEEKLYLEVECIKNSSMKEQDVFSEQEVNARISSHWINQMHIKQSTDPPSLITKIWGFFGSAYNYFGCNDQEKGRLGDPSIELCG